MDPVHRTSSPYIDPTVKGPQSKILSRNHPNIQEKMVTTTVNKTNLHPSGVAPHPEPHTEIEEQLHEQAHIDYNRVAIISHPSVPALYEDALVYEPGSGISATGALTAYSGKKTGRSPSDKRIVKEPSSEKDIWWGPVNKPMTPDLSAPVFLLLCFFVL
ncbi:uncharacterized protein SPSK_02692 [Sporothrix schenckii 1099-18]|uniref:Phosphoenolpyruvate carboxykinase (ATP) n=1 Tax=Sporothrix schenckii 1099-18 TaxID=1397361 RepID=A0A0F2MBY0_SPOSC|nr:uncharacterized protein SPSK_02692 [Sporothrix schenckii 1099-18]KJR86345.1 hypothetical protein SPSK_02692 [Sporothrix schenckii 1099-18]